MLIQSSGSAASPIPKNTVKKIVPRNVKIAIKYEANDNGMRT